MTKIFYRDGYKYQLKQHYTLHVNMKPPVDIDTQFIKFSTSGVLTIKSGYAWDGASGPTTDTKNFMRGSLVHDALYQLMRENHLDHLKFRKLADQELKKICLEDGMSSFRANLVYFIVRWFGDYAADPANNHAIIEAP